MSHRETGEKKGQAKRIGKRQYQEAETALKRGIYRELYARGILSERQLYELLGQNGGDPEADALEGF